MQVDAVSENEQKTLARIAGAMAHELNNPLQGVLSLVGVTLRECSSDERCQSRLEQIHRGVTRLSRTVESLSAIYENLPRSPDFVSLSDWLNSLAATLTECGFRARVHPANTDSMVSCFAPELLRLTGDLFREQAAPMSRIQLITRQTAGQAEVVCEAESENPPQSPDDDWLNLDNLDSVSGLAVLIDEMIKLSYGQVEFKWRDSSLTGLRLRMTSA